MTYTATTTTDPATDIPEYMNIFAWRKADEIVGKGPSVRRERSEILMAIYEAYLRGKRDAEEEK